MQNPINAIDWNPSAKSQSSVAGDKFYCKIFMLFSPRTMNSQVGGHSFRLPIFMAIVCLLVALVSGASIPNKHSPERLLRLQETLSALNDTSSYKEGSNEAISRAIAAVFVGAQIRLEEFNREQQILREGRERQIMQEGHKRQNHSSWNLFRPWNRWF